MTRRQRSLSKQLTIRCLGTAACAATFYLAGCSRCSQQAGPPARAHGIPQDAVWAGGVDGGAWIACRVIGRRQADCAIYWENGDLDYEGSFESTVDLGNDALLYDFYSGDSIGLLPSGRLNAKMPAERAVSP